MIAGCRFARAVCFTGALLLLPTSPVSAESWRVTLRGNGPIASRTLVVAPVDVPLPPGNYFLQRVGNGPDISAELFHDGSKSYLVFELDGLTESGPMSYKMERIGYKGNGVLESDGPKVLVTAGGKPFTEYLSGSATKPYYSPLIGPTGAPFTRAFPMKKVAGEDTDHPHQRSMWFSHGDVNGIDFWASDPLNPPDPKFGSIKETSRTIVAGAFTVGVLRTTDDWLGSDGKKVCEDERTVLFVGFQGPRYVDFDIAIKATAGPVTFGDTKEGMFGLRVASTMDVKRKLGGKITNAEGITDGDAWGKPSPWVDYTGPIDGKTVGIAILNHPESFRYPTTWHVRDYGLFAANPFGWHDFGQKRSGAYTIPAGESIRFRYRVILHTGETASADLPGAFRAFAKPPTIDVRPE